MTPDPPAKSDWGKRTPDYVIEPWSAPKAPLEAATIARAGEAVEKFLNHLHAAHEAAYDFKEQG